MSPAPAPRGDGPSRGTPADPSRRLTLSPIGFDIVLALAMTPDGFRLAELAHVIAAPVSSVQTALRILHSNGIVERLSSEPPLHRLDPAHPAHAELVSLAGVLPDPARSISIALRASPAVAWAAVDAAGFLVAMHVERDDATLALERHLDLVASARPGSPPVMTMSEPEARRLLRVSVDLRQRAASAVVLRGTTPGTAGGTDAGRRAG